MGFLDCKPTEANSNAEEENKQGDVNHCVERSGGEVFAI